MAYHNNVDGALAEASLAIKKALQDKVAMIVHNTITTYMETNFYSYKPKQYQRTYELFNSLIVSKIQNNGGYGNFTVNIFFDTSLINPYYSTGQHVENGEDISDQIPWMAEMGYINPYQSDHRGGFVEDSLEELLRTDKHIIALANELKAKGLKVIVK